MCVCNMYSYDVCLYDISLSVSIYVLGVHIIRARCPYNTCPCASVYVMCFYMIVYSVCDVFLYNNGLCASVHLIRVHSTRSTW